MFEDGTSFLAEASYLLQVVLGGRLFRGEERLTAAVSVKPALIGWPAITREGLPVARLKTGTRPFIDARKVDWSRLVRQPSDRRP